MTTWTLPTTEPMKQLLDTLLDLPVDADNNGKELLADLLADDAGPASSRTQGKRLLDTGESTGKQLLDNLARDIGLTDTDERPVKRVRTVAVPDVRRFDARDDGFKMTTTMVKVIVQVAECFKEDISANVQFGPKGITIFALYHGKTVCISTKLGRDLFSDFYCPKEVNVSLNLVVLAKKLSNLHKCKVQQLTFENDDDNLVLVGQLAENDPPARIMLKSEVASDVDELDLGDIDYAVPIRLVASEFAKQIECMPATFTIHMDAVRGNLVFKGDEDQSTTTLSLRLEQDVLTKIQQHADVRDYRATFLKANIGAILKGAKIAEYVIVAFTQDSPLFVRYIINESSDMDPDQNSRVTMWFAPKLNDDLDFE